MYPQVLSKALVRTLIVSVGAHLALAVAIFIGAEFSSYAAIRRPRHAITTKLVRLGKKRSKELLPRIHKPPPPPKKVVNVAQTPSPIAPAPVHDAAGALQRARDMTATSRALSRLKAFGSTTDDEPEGDPDGVAEGDVSDAALAIMGNRYVTEIYRCLKKYYAIEGINPTKVMGREVEVSVRVDGTGRLLDAKLLKPSGLKAFDRGVMRSVQQCGKISPPPEALKQEVAGDGLVIVFRP